MNESRSQILILYVAGLTTSVIPALIFKHMFIAKSLTYFIVLRQINELLMGFKLYFLSFLLLQPTFYGGKRW